MNNEKKYTTKSSSANFTELELLRLVAKSWNHLDIKYIENVLADDFTYESQWVLTPISDKKIYLNYLKKKFDTIKKSIDGYKVVAELAIHPSYDNRTIIVLSQYLKEGIRKSSLLVQIHEDKIQSINICFIPNPEMALLSGEIPT